MFTGPNINQKEKAVSIALQIWVEKGVEGIDFKVKSSSLKTFTISNISTLIQPNNRVLSNKDLGKLITEVIIYPECHMTIAKIKKMIVQAIKRKAFFRDFK